MCPATALICIFVLVQGKSSPLSSNITSFDDTCDHPWKANFGFQVNGSLRDSLESLSNIIKGFLTKYISGHEEAIRVKLYNCIYNQDCRLHIVLDKRNQNKMVLCAVVQEAESCFVSTCLCTNNRPRRGINSHLIPAGSGKKIKEPTCTVEVVSNKTIFGENGTSVKSKTDAATFELGVTDKNHDDRNKIHVSGDSNWIHGFFIGLGIGVLLGGFPTFVWFKKKSSLQKILPEINGIFKSTKPQDDKVCNHDVAEYSEIPDSEQMVECTYQYKDSPKHATRAKFHSSVSLVVHIDACEHARGPIFQKEEKDNVENTDDGGLAKKPGSAPSMSEYNTGIQQEKNSYVNNGEQELGQDDYLIPFNMNNVTKTSDMCIEFSRDTNDVDKTDIDEEDKVMATHHVQLYSLNDNASYFVLSANEKKKSSVQEFTGCEVESEKSKRTKVPTENVNEASEYENVDEQDSENIYFKLSKST